MFPICASIHCHFLLIKKDAINKKKSTKVTLNPFFEQKTQKMAVEIDDDENKQTETLSMMEECLVNPNLVLKSTWRTE